MEKSLGFNAGKSFLLFNLFWIINHIIIKILFKWVVVKDEAFYYIEIIF